MKELVDKYVKNIAVKFSYPETSEMGYRADLEELLKGIFESINVQRIDHDAKSDNGNKPDFVVRKNDVPILYIEAKDIGVPLDRVEKSEQMSRYFGYENLVLTDYIELRFYRNGVRYEDPIIIAKCNLKNRQIEPVAENYEHLTKSLLDFSQSHKEPIRSGEHLAKIMGGKAQRIRDNVRQFFEKEEKSGEIHNVYETIKKLLVHDLTPEAFADLYAQTLVYGLFVARYYDKTPENFSRQEARDLLPTSNPFLGHFFDHISGRNFDKRLSYIVDELCEVFMHADVQQLMTQYFKKDLFGEEHAGPDPVIHFYEDFLKEYDSALRKKMGAYYTPLPVVRFIVRSIDSLLEKEFGLKRGLADTSKIGDFHRVQVLDPAVGTGTFISAVIRKIYEHIKNENQLGTWTSYVHHDLLPRIHGFELMMASYTIAHLKLSMAFKDTGFKYFNNTRLGVYLTNSLEESSRQDVLAFDLGAAIAEEAKMADEIKNHRPIMVVLGNPPYSVSSSNKGKWIQDLIKVYKENLGEKKINLDDDYIKFIRLAEHFIEKNKTGIVAMITNNSFIDGITHRQMRKHLLETFDDIYILDLHGNMRKGETKGDDENIFAIQQGVSINIFVRKNENKTELGNVYHSEISGKRKRKFEILNESGFEDIKWQKLNYKEPNYFFVPKNFDLEEEYQSGFKLSDLFPNYNSGIQTKNDELTIQFSEAEIACIVSDFMNFNLQEINKKYEADDSGIWKVSLAKTDLEKRDYTLTPILYRPFDIRYTAVTPRSSGFLARPRFKTTKEMLYQNTCLLFSRSVPNQGMFSEVFVSKMPSDLHAAAGQTYCGPLFEYDLDGVKQTPNLDKDICRKFTQIEPKAEAIDVFDYIYAVLYSPSFRKKYQEFLKIDFPRVPYPKDKKQFEELAKLGKELRELHLFESSLLEHLITSFNVDGSNVVEKVEYKNGKVHINDSQYFDGVPELAWNFYIGGYQSAQKWLKDRKGRELTPDDINHYQKIIVALVETDRVMKEIDSVT